MLSASFFIVMSIVVMLSVIMLSVIMLSVIMLIVIMLSVIMLKVIMLSVIMLNVIKLSVVMLSVVVPFHPGLIFAGKASNTSEAHYCTPLSKGWARLTVNISANLRFYSINYRRKISILLPLGHLNAPPTVIFIVRVFCNFSLKCLNENFPGWCQVY